VTKEEYENLLSELIFQSYQSALNQDGAATRANEIKEQLLEAWNNEHSVTTSRIFCPHGYLLHDPCVSE